MGAKKSTMEHRELIAWPNGCNQAEPAESTRQSSLLPTALRLAEDGYPVFPCKTRGKVPLTQHGHNVATTDKGKIRAWWAKWPEANIGVPTGMKTFHVVDIDQKDDIDGQKSLDALEAEFGRLPQTVEVVTGSGGRHFYFKFNESVLGSSVSKLGPGIDTRGDGGSGGSQQPLQSHWYQGVCRL